MPLRAPLAALLLLCASFARADACNPNGLTVEALAPYCGGPPTTEVPRKCSEYVSRTLGACRNKLKIGLIEQLRQEKKPPSPERDAALAKAEAEVKAAENAFAMMEASAISVKSVDPDGPNPFQAEAFGFWLMENEYDYPPSHLINNEKVSANLAARKEVALDPDDTTGGGSGIPPLKPETERKLVALATKIVTPPTGKPDAQIQPDQLANGAELYLLANRPGQAEGPAKLLVEKRDKRGPGLLAQVALMRGRPEEAAQWAEQALALDPNDKRAKDALAFAKAQISAAKLKKPGAVGFGEKAPEDRGGPGVAQAAGLPAGPPAGVTFTPKTALAPGLRRAYEKLKMNDLVEALAELNVHLDAKPDDREARTVRAEVLLKLGKPEPALADCDRVLADDPNDARALRAKAAALYDLGRDAEALAAIEKALTLDAGSAAAHLIRAKILERLGRAAEALAEYDNAARLDAANEPIAEAAAKRLGRAAAEPRAVARRFLRGGFVAVATALLLLGLIGGGVAYTRRRTTSKPAAAARERTLGKGDLVARQYRITRELGRGGMGVVFEALDEKLNRSVALKQLSAECRGSAEDAARFLQEARLVAQLKHPNVAEIHAAVEDGGLFLVFELVRGKSLDRLLAGPIGPDQARGIISAACAALTAAHARRIVHRDLKPSNIMISDDGEIKVMDFGIAHQSRGGATMTQTAFSGTPPYMAPEQAMGSVSSASDLYALGVMAYELVTGVRPFDGPDYLGPKMRGDFPRATSRSGKLPAKLDAFFASALSPDPAKRPRDAKAFAEAFADCWS